MSGLNGWINAFISSFVIMTPSFNAINCRKQSETTHSTVLKGLKLEIFYTIDISQNYSLKSSFGGCIKCKVSLDKKNFNK